MFAIFRELSMTAENSELFAIIFPRNQNSLKTFES